MVSVDVKHHVYLLLLAVRTGLVRTEAVRRSIGLYTDIGSILRFGSPFSSTVVTYGLSVVVTSPLTINETLKWISSQPILMQNHSGGSPTPPPPPPAVLPPPHPKKDRWFNIDLKVVRVTDAFFTVDWALNTNFHSIILSVWVWCYQSVCTVTNRTQEALISAYRWQKKYAWLKFLALILKSFYFNFIV